MAQSPPESSGAKAWDATTETQPGRIQYEVCVSFAGEDRAFVETVLDGLRRHGVSCFYGLAGQQDLPGKDLYSRLDRVYRKHTRHCLVFVSGHYPARQWATHEHKGILGRAAEGAGDYIIPICLDDTEIPSVLPALDCIDGRGLSPSQTASLIREKISH